MRTLTTLSKIKGKEMCAICERYSIANIWFDEYCIEIQSTPKWTLKSQGIVDACASQLHSFRVGFNSKYVTFSICVFAIVKSPSNTLNSA